MLTQGASPRPSPEGRARRATSFGTRGSQVQILLLRPTLSWSSPSWSSPLFRPQLRPHRMVGVLLLAVPARPCGMSSTSSSVRGSAVRPPGRVGAEIDQSSRLPGRRAFFECLDGLMPATVRWSIPARPTTQANPAAVARKSCRHRQFCRAPPPSELGSSHRLLNRCRVHATMLARHSLARECSQSGVLLARR